MSATSRSTEARRCRRLHEAFLEVKRRHEIGTTQLRVLLRGLSRRMLRGPAEAYSQSSIRRLYDAWRRDPRPETLAHRYKPKTPTTPPAIVDAVLRCLRANPTLRIGEAFKSVHAAWIARSARRSGSAKQFPTTLRSIRRHITARMPIPWTQQRRRRLAAMAEFAALDAMLGDSISTPPNHNK